MRRNLRSMAHGASRGAWVELSAHLVHSLPGLQHHESSARWPGKKPHQRQGRYTKGHGGLDACDLQGFICFTGQPDSAHGHWVHSNSCAICQLWVRKRCPPKLFLRSHLLLLRKANARSSQQPGTLDSGPRQTAADKGEQPAGRAASCDATRAIAETGVIADLPKKESLFSVQTCHVHALICPLRPDTQSFFDCQTSQLRLSASECCALKAAQASVDSADPLLACQGRARRLPFIPFLPPVFFPFFVFV